MFVSYFRCKNCGSIRQYGGTTVKLPCKDIPSFNREPLLVCNDNCSGLMVHTPHEFAANEPIFPSDNETLSDAIFKRSADIRVGLSANGIRAIGG